MAVLGDVAQLVISGEFLGEDCQNVFFYRLEDVPTEGWAEGLATDFIADVLDVIRDIQSPQFQWKGIQVTNLFDPLDLYEAPLSLAGQWTGATAATDLPAFMSATFKLTRGNITVRNGRKAFAGLNEVMMANGVADTGYVATCALVSAVLDEDLEPGVGTDVFRPVIVKRVPYVTSEGHPSHRLPESQVEMGTNWAYVVSASFQRISTQNTRKGF